VAWWHLEPGPLRDELCQAAETPQPLPPEPPQHSTHIVFDGSGKEYFRIWVVHTVLTLLTLGVYSAWAKVRKMQWFARHTAILGDRFDYHADPWRILMGRSMAVVLLILWVISFDVSFAFGMSVLGLMCLIGPVLFVEAQRFKLANTSWRGIRFGFDVPRREAYVVCVPPLLLWTSGTVAQAQGLTGAPMFAVGALFLLAMPWAHARLKAMQHQHARLGSHRFTFRPAVAAYYGLYLRAFGYLIVGAVCGAVVSGVWSHATRSSSGDPWMPMLSALITTVIVWIFFWPIFAAHHQQLVWRQTSLGEIRFEGQMQTGRLWRLVLVQTALVLVTIGLYWPFAAVAIARYRVESIRVFSAGPLEDRVFEASTSDTQRSAGDASADAFGLDLGW
jgi:uncharacterized membrane protein YjgN (DUF898 family)